MPRLILILALLLIALVVWYKIKNAKGEQRKKIIFWTIASGIIAVLALLAMTGKLNWITAAIGAVVAFIPKLMGYLKYLPLISRFYAQTKQQQGGGQQQRQPPPSKTAMSKQDALDVLGLKPGASKDEIIAAHKRMMQKVHPDRGGSDHLAAEINQAKDTLLS